MYIGLMCGIAGLAGETPDNALLERMADAMRQRGPDGEGTWADQDLGLAFRRLAIIDLNARANQPMHFERWHLAFNGEIYNYLELRAELEARGHTFKTTGDTEVLLHAWAEWGQQTLDRVNGMFGFAVWDDEERSLTLACDPFGEKPLFYWSDGERLVFASDLRALLQHPGVPSATDDETLACFIARGGGRPDPTRTFLAGVQRLPAAHKLVWRDRRLEVERYWTPQAVDVPDDYEAATAAYRELLTDSVRLRLRSDVPVGTSLSGGLDSSSIVALIREIAPEHARHAFTARFPGFARDEWRYAEAVGKQAGIVEHHVVDPTASDLRRDLDRFLDDHQEPVGSCSIYAQWRVNQMAHEAGVTVLLDGQGNDELIGGYPDAPGFALRSAGAGHLAKTALRRPEVLRPVARSLMIDHLPTSAARAYLRRASTPYLARDRAALASRSLVRHPPLVPEADGFRRYLLRQTFESGLPTLLLWADRSSMAHSREVRLPFLDRRIAEFSMSLPPRYAYREGFTKRILRDALADSIPANVLWRRDKVGFEPPQKAWLNEPAMREHIAEVLLDGSARGRSLYDSGAIENDYRAGEWSDHHGIWRAFNTELWLRAGERRRSSAPAPALH